MQASPGKFYGIGVGPGDPDLITVKSTRILQQVDVVFTAASTKNTYSLAVDIARSHIPSHVPIIKLDFPMTKDRKVKKAAWQAHGQTILNELRQGKQVAFLTLGDPLTYSTYGYVLKEIQMMAPDIPVKTIPGITSYQAAAASLNTPLVEGEESLLILSGVNGGDRLRELEIKPDTVVFLKAYRNIKGIADALDESGMLPGSVGVSNCALPNESIEPDVKGLVNKPPNYWTLIIAKQKKSDVPPKP